jgi:polysaccharide biosynthesis/export protein
VLPFCPLMVLLAASPAKADDTKRASPPDATSSATIADSAGQNADRPALQHRNPRYRLNRSDVLNLDFPLTPEFSQTVIIQPDGFITLRSVGEVHVEGQTLAEATQTIRTAYANVLHNPIITIDLKDFEKPYFIAGGQVGHPGKYDLRGDTTLIQAVEVAGGFTEDSKHSEVWLFRRVSDEWVEVHKFNVKKMLGNGDLHEDTHLNPGDMVYVPKNGISKVRRYLPVATMGSYFNPAP